MKRKSSRSQASARTSKEASAGGQAPWWLNDEQGCGFCLQTHAYNVHWHCAGCDALVCPGCVIVVRESREILCPTCAEESEP